MVSGLLQDLSEASMSSAASSTTGLHLAAVRAFCDQAPIEPNRFTRNYRAWLAHYYNLLIPAGASVLEIGCGSGELLVRLNARRKVGVDLSERQVAAARARCGADTRPSRSHVGIDASAAIREALFARPRSPLDCTREE
jgi:SAM-dependent methyltransferase